MRIFLLFLIICFTVFVETNLSLPLSLCALIVIASLQKKSWVFALALFAGILLDSIFFRPLGITSFFFLLVVGLIFLYQRKFETQTFTFLFFATTITTFFYEWFFVQISFITLFIIFCTDVCSLVTFGILQYITLRSSNH